MSGAQLDLVGALARLVDAGEIEPALPGAHPVEMQAALWHLQHAGSKAAISADGAYRWFLQRRVGPGSRVLLFVMLNPSTADAHKPDPTITRCLDYARRWGFDVLQVVNLYALRSTDPAGLRLVADPVGAANDSWIVWCAAQADRVVVAWGTSGGKRSKPRQQHVLQLLEQVAEVPVYCLAKGKHGDPVHPLMQRADLVPQLFTVAA